MEARIVVISDTHGRIDQAVLAVCAGADHIIHAGDVGARSVLDELQRLAPVTAVHGNRDRDVLGSELPAEAVGEAGGLRFVVAHKRRDLKAGHPDPAAEGLGLLVYGHTHQPELRYRGHLPGLRVMAIILLMGAVSGAHLNPAVSLAFAARGNLPWRPPARARRRQERGGFSTGTYRAAGDVRRPGVRCPPRLSTQAVRPHRHGTFA